MVGVSSENAGQCWLMTDCAMCKTDGGNADKFFAYEMLPAPLHLPAAKRCVGDAGTTGKDTVVYLIVTHVRD